MTLLQEAEQLRLRLKRLANSPEWSLMVRYELLPQKTSPIWRKRIIQRTGRLMRVVGLSRARYRSQKWDVGLNHAGVAVDACPVLIWAEGVPVERLRELCAALHARFLLNPGLAPVLVTDVADFAGFSRLGWLVEYLPLLSGEGISYRDRKRNYLAWRYRDAVVIPVSAGFASDAEWLELVGQVQTR